MSRAELRRQQKAEAKSQKTYALTAAQITALKKQVAAEVEEKVKKQQFYDLSTEIFTWTVSASLKVLHDNYGFGSKRLGDFAEAVCKLFNDGDIDLLAIQQEVYEKTGVKVGVE